MTTNAITCWDFTIHSVYCSKEELTAWCIENCKKWCFQLEKGEVSGRYHWQGRVSLKVKNRICPTKGDWKSHNSATSSQNQKNDFYVMKNETRIEGPFSNETYVYIPRQVREIVNLYPWQNRVCEIATQWDKDRINVIIDHDGGIGKSTLVTYMRCHGIARKLPYANDFKDIMRMSYCLPTSKCYLIDMPRAINKDRLFQMYGAIEELKNGYCWDDRYEFKEKIFDSPQIFIFTNELPDFSLLSGRRWVLWEVSNNELIPYERNEDTSDVHQEILRISGATL